jgi:hypothetical protein
MKGVSGQSTSGVRQTLEVRQPDDGLIEQLVGHVVEWRLVTPAIAFLHLHKPLSFLGSQAFLMLQPLLDALTPRDLTSRWITLMADRTQVERLIARLEAER